MGCRAKTNHLDPIFLAPPPHQIMIEEKSSAQVQQGYNATISQNIHLMMLSNKRFERKNLATPSQVNGMSTEQAKIDE